LFFWDDELDELEVVNGKQGPATNYKNCKLMTDFGKVNRGLQQNAKTVKSLKNVYDLVSVVVKSFEACPSEKSNHIFLSLQLCMLEIMKSRGSQNYKVQHMNKKTIEREGELLEQIKCDFALLQEVEDYLS
jgi:enolase